MKPSTLKALLEGDIENAIISETPGGIEAQEAAGQRLFVASETLPKECLGCTRQQLEQMGIVFGEDTDGLFVPCMLPEGWRKEATDHSMWSKLLDDKGRERASIFYKAAFYDRSAHISLSRRFSASTEPVLGWDSDHKTGQWHGVVKDGNVVIWNTDPIGPEPDYKNREAYLAWLDKKEQYSKFAISWLDTHYPDWRNPLAYWD